MGRSIAFYFSVLSGYMAQYAKTKLQYRGDLVTQIFSDLLSQAVNLVFILVVFQHVPLLHGWSRWEIIFIYGYFLIPFSIFQATAANLWNFTDRYIVLGEMDRLLLRPISPLFQVILETFEAESLFGAVVGGVVMAVAGAQLGLQWQWWDPLVLLIMAAGSTLVYHGVFVALAAVGFWTDSRTGIIPLAWNLNHYGRYPVNIYNKLLRLLLTFILPFAFVGFYPSTYFLDRQQWALYALLTPLAGLIVFAGGLAVWRSGIKRYQGAGS